MNDDELRARLKAADPARAVDEDVATGPSWIDDLTEATMTETTKSTAPSTEGQPEQPRRRLWIPAAAAAAVLAATAIALTAGGDDDVPPAAQPAVGMTLTLPADDAMASCMQLSAESLRPMEVAFSGTATTVEDTTVTITPDRWYKGGTGATSVQLTTMGEEMVALLGSVQFEQGQRYLVTATDGQVNACGFSAEWTPELAQVFEQAFG